MSNQSGAHNTNGRCTDSAVWLTREADQNAIGDTFRNMVSNFPIAGGFFAGMVPDTYTANAVRQCPGATIDHSTGYGQEYVLLGLIAGLIFIYAIID